MNTAVHVLLRRPMSRGHYRDSSLLNFPRSSECIPLLPLPGSCSRPLSPRMARPFVPRNRRHKWRDYLPILSTHAQCRCNELQHQCRMVLWGGRFAHARGAGRPMVNISLLLLLYCLLWKLHNNGGLFPLLLQCQPSRFHDKYCMAGPTGRGQVAPLIFVDLLC